MITQTTNRNVVYCPTRPHKRQEGREEERKCCTNEKDGVGFELEEKLVGSARGKESEDVSDGNLKENNIHDLTVCESSYSHVLEEATLAPGIEGKVEK
jgi:hypothetical protein